MILSKVRALLFLLSFKLISITITTLGTMNSFSTTVTLDTFRSLVSGINITIITIITRYSDYNDSYYYDGPLVRLLSTTGKGGFLTVPVPGTPCLGFVSVPGPPKYPD